MTKEKEYTVADIEDLSDREHVRKRTQMYGGNTNPATYQIPLLFDSLIIKNITFIPAVYKAIGEIIDNATDEFAHLKKRNKVLKITANTEKGVYRIEDNGRGIPIATKKDRDGKEVWVPEMVLSRLRSGRNFSDNKEKGVIGMNGIGSAFCAFCSSDFRVKIQRDGKKYSQRFVDGTLKISKPKIEPAPNKLTGTCIEFRLDDEVFSDISLPDELFVNRAIEIALCNPDVTVEYNQERYHFKRGFKEIIKKSYKRDQVFTFTIESEKVSGDIHVIINAHDDEDEKIFTWVNSSLLFDGGKCNTQIINGITDIAINFLQKEAKKRKIVINKTDVRKGLMVLANFKISNPEYDSQAKTRLTNPDIKKELVAAFTDQWKACLKTMPGWMGDIIERASERYHLQSNKKAQDEHKRNMKKRVEGLLDATSKIRNNCSLLITEGDSAKAKICEVRDPKTLGAFALTGKINNVYDSTPAQALKMGKISDMLLAIGLTPGIKANRETLNYGRIIIATDADPDGGSIFTLLVNCFYRYWKELFDPNYQPVVYRLVAPNVVASKGKTRVHFATRAEFEKKRENYKNYTIEYMKGLGSMITEDWKQILENNTGLIPIVDDGNLQDVLHLAFSSDTQARKNWLSVEDAE